MKMFLVLAATLVVYTQCTTSSKLYIVRHAEKDSIGRDPDLSEAGKERAVDLANFMSNKKIKNIYSTRTKRTQQTAEPLSKKIGVPILAYENDTLQKFLYRILENGRNVLIVAHSNTALRMLKELSLDPSLTSIPDDDYDNLFIVTLMSKTTPSEFRLKLKETTYGKKSPAPEN